LPFIEQVGTFELGHIVNATQNYYAYTTTGNQSPTAAAPHVQTVKIYLCPSDPTLSASGTNATGYANSSYALNGQLFTKPASDGSTLQARGATNGAGNAQTAGSSVNFQIKIPESMPDGTSQTILMAEKYSDSAWVDTTGAWGGSPLVTYTGGSCWDYSAANWSDWSTMFALRAGFIYPPGTAATAMNTNGVGTVASPKVMPQFQPYPPARNCDPALPSTGHGAGMVILLGDGSVRVISKGISVQTWWALVTPGARDFIGKDINY